MYVVATRSQRQISTQLPEKRLESSDSTYDKELNSSKAKSRHFRRPSAWTSSWRRLDNAALTFRLSYVTREGFRDILCEIQLAAWNSSLRRAPQDCALARAVAVVCWQVPLKKAEKLSCHVSSTVTSIFLVGEKRFAWYCSRIWIRRKSKSAPEYFGICSSKTPYSIEGVWIPNQEGREDVPSELSFSVSAPEADPTPYSDAFERGDSPGTDLS